MPRHPLTFGSVFAGVGGFDLGFERAGLASHWQIEIDGFCRRVLARHWPDVRRVEDVADTCGGMLRVSRADMRCAECGRSGFVPYADVICGGFPCQDVSIAGKRKGLAGERSGLFFQFMRIVAELRPSWVVIENVDGLLSSHAGADFGLILRELGNVGYVGAWRVLDSRWFGVPQRRNRVFLVGHRGSDIGRARSVLFESARRSWDSATGAQAEAHVAATLRGRAHSTGIRPPGRGGEDDVNLVAPTLTVNGHARPGDTLSGVDSLQVSGPLGGGDNGIGRRSEDDPNLVVAHALSSSSSRTGRLDPNGETFIASALTSSMGHRGYGSPRGDANDNLVAGTLGTSGGARQHLEQHYEPEPKGVRRLTPLECERLQGFPDGWTCLCGCEPYSTRSCRCKDSPRYKALGNAVTVNVIEWIGRRLLATAAQEQVA